MDKFILVCLMVQNISIGPKIRIELVNAAKRLARDGKNNGKIKEKNAEGYIKTDWQTACCGSFSGFKFEAQLETDHGKGRVSFLMDEDELVSDTIYDEENSFWMDYPTHPARTAERAYLN